VELAVLNVGLARRKVELAEAMREFHAPAREFCVPMREFCVPGDPAGNPARRDPPAAQPRTPIHSPVQHLLGR
jgi:hypothetical protein